MNRKILHVDMDAFFAAVEQLDHPELRGKPVVIGGGKRGVVATASYEARKFGVHSAMSSVLAKKLCPDCIFVKGNYQRYKEISNIVFTILSDYTDVVESVSIDEAYLDVTDLYVSPVVVAKEIKARVKEATGLTISVGVSYNKFLAKLASDWQKPDGLFVISEEDIPDLLKPLPILKVHGLGIKTAERLNRIGIYTIDDLLRYDPEHLSYFLGESWATEICNRINGIDNREVKNNGKRKSYGMERTYSEDLVNQEEIKALLYDYAEKMLSKLKKEGKAAKTLTVKIKYFDFEQITRSHSLPSFSDNIDEFKQIIDLLLKKVDFEKSIRLAGISYSNISENEDVQLSIFS